MTGRAWHLLAAIAVLVVVGLAVLGGRGPSPAASSAVGSNSPSPAIAPSSPAQTPSASPSPSAAASSSSTVNMRVTATLALTRDGSAAEPKRALTPGAADPRVTQATIGSTICGTGYTATVRPRRRTPLRLRIASRTGSTTRSAPAPCALSSPSSRSLVTGWRTGRRGDHKGMDESDHPVPPGLVLPGGYPPSKWKPPCCSLDSSCP